MAEKQTKKVKLGSMIIKSTIRKYVNSKGCNVSSEVLNKTLNNTLKKILDNAIEKAKSQNRKTLKPKDVSI